MNINILLALVYLGIPCLVLVSAGYDDCNIYGNCEPVTTTTVTGSSSGGPVAFKDLDFTGTFGFDDWYDNDSGGGYIETDPFWSANYSDFLDKITIGDYWSNATQEFLLIEKWNATNSSYLTSYTETDPFWTANYSDFLDKITIGDYWSNATQEFLRSYTETDPYFVANWSAYNYSWGYYEPNTDTTYTAGTGIDITNEEVNISMDSISNVETSITANDWIWINNGGESKMRFSGVLSYLNGALDFFSGSWNDLTDIPSGFADDVDNDTTYTHLSNFTNDINGSGKVNITYSWGENAALSSGTYEWSIGNGESGSYVDSKIMQDGKIVGMHLHCNTAGPTSVEVEAQIDGVSSGCSVTGSGTDEFDSCDVDLSSGEKITPYTITGGTHSNCIVSIIVQHDLGVGGEDAWKHQVLTFSEGRMWADLTVDYDNRDLKIPYSGFYTRCSGRFRDFSFNYGPTTQLELTENGSWMFYTRVNNSNSGFSINQTSILGVLQDQPRYNYTTTDDLTFPKNSWITVYADRLASGIDWNHALFEVKVELNDNDCLYN